MTDISSLFILFLLSILGIIVLGVIAGLSPSLFISQSVVESNPKTAKRTIYALLCGVLIAAALLLTVFETFNLTSLLQRTETIEEALLFSVCFNIIIGLLFVFGGLRYLGSRDKPESYQVSDEMIVKLSRRSTLAGFGFTKTFLSISGVTAIFIAANLIATIAHGSTERFVISLVFLGALSAPFIGLHLLMIRSPEKLQTAAAKLKTGLGQFNYRSSVGIAALLFGGAIVIFNMMMALFY